jgi:hypothetical protein
VNCVLVEPSRPEGGCSTDSGGGKATPIKKPRK